MNHTQAIYVLCGSEETNEVTSFDGRILFSLQSVETLQCGFVKTSWFCRAVLISVLLTVELCAASW